MLFARIFHVSIHHMNKKNLITYCNVWKTFVTRQKVVTEKLLREMLEYHGMFFFTETQKVFYERYHGWHFIINDGDDVYTIDIKDSARNYVHTTVKTLCRYGIECTDTVWISDVITSWIVNAKYHDELENELITVAQTLIEYFDVSVDDVHDVLPLVDGIMVDGFIVRDIHKNSLVEVILSNVHIEY